MRDPEMVSRAQKAAATLERAWERWRIMHGLSAEPMPPVSSYVGYSIEEPWGRPRVVFGVDAREAELLAALLDRHGCAGPLYQPGPDEVTDRGAKAALATDPLLEEARSRIPAPAQSAEEERWVRDAQRSPAVGAAGGTATGDTAPEPPRRPGRRAPAGDSGRDNNPPGLPYASDADAAPAASDERPARRGERRAEPAGPPAGNGAPAAASGRPRGRPTGIRPRGRPTGIRRRGRPTGIRRRGRPTGTRPHRSQPPRSRQPRSRASGSADRRPSCAARPSRVRGAQRSSAQPPKRTPAFRRPRKLPSRPYPLPGSHWPHRPTLPKGTGRRTRARCGPAARAWMPGSPWPAG